MKRILTIVLLIMSCAPIIRSITVAAAPTQRQEIAITEPTLSTRRGAIEITCPADGRTYTFQIYAITGQLLKRIQVTETSVTIELPQGCYIVKCGSWVKKAIVC